MGHATPEVIIISPQALRCSRKPQPTRARNSGAAKRAAVFPSMRTSRGERAALALAPHHPAVRRAGPPADCAALRVRMRRATWIRLCYAGHASATRATREVVGPRLLGSRFDCGRKMLGCTGAGRSDRARRGVAAMILRAQIADSLAVQPLATDTRSSSVFELAIEQGATTVMENLSIPGVSHSRWRC